MPTAPDRPLPELRVLETPDAVADVAAAEIARILGEAIRERGEAHWATTGGSSATPIYRRLGADPLRGSLDWGRVHVWWGDDRFVPLDHAYSNALALEQVLLDSGGDEANSGASASDVGGHGNGVRIPSDHIHPVPSSAAIAHGTGPEGAATAYAATIASLVPADDAGTPEFDLVVVGVGPDGHLLSVFPGSAAWDAAELCVAVPAPAHVEPHVARVTMHPRVLAAARRVLLVTTGASKAPRIGQAWTGDDVRELPARAARLATATWLLDEAAAADLPRD